MSNTRAVHTDAEVKIRPGTVRGWPLYITVGEWVVADIPGNSEADARPTAERIAGFFTAAARPFKRHADPHGCPERSGHNCLGVRMHCRLEAGHPGTHAMEVSTPYHLARLSPTHTDLMISPEGIDEALAAPCRFVAEPGEEDDCATHYLAGKTCRRRAREAGRG